MPAPLHPNDLRKLLEGARLYAEAERSDPFTHRRALAHIRSGVCGWREDDLGAGKVEQELVGYFAQRKLNDAGTTDFHSRRRP